MAHFLNPPLDFRLQKNKILLRSVSNFFENQDVSTRVGPSGNPSNLLTIYSH